jgi:CheY-like chemotaxis protein/HPt (histidine-containing phosphotransfer) domain-containing protein
MIRFQIQDTGIGIPKEKVDQLFMPFIQLDASTTRKFGGSGLGLSISKKLTEMMKGEIGLESEPGRGSVFWFTVRLGRPEHSHAFEVDRYADLRALKVLLVDDNASALAAVATMLADVGCACTTLQDPAALLPSLEAAVCANDPFSAILLDYSLPGRDGGELAREIQARYPVNIILLLPTGVQLSSDEATQLIKPVRRVSLYHCLESGLGGGQERDRRPTQKIQDPADETNAFLGRNVRILLVEDNPVNQDVATSILRKNHINVDAVANGQEAVQALSYRLYDLILMDVHMPVMDGFAATAVIRDESSHVLNHRVPIIALTASAMRGDQEMCIRAGMDDYLAKPIRPNELLTKLNRWLAISLSRVNSNTGYLQNRPFSAASLAQMPSAPAYPSNSPEADDPDADLVIDIDQLCHRMMDDRALALDLLRKSAVRLDNDLEEVKAAFEREDLVFLKQIAHKLKGSAANLSAEPTRKASEMLEKAVAGQDWEAISMWVGALAVAVTNFQDAVQHLPQD